MSKATAMNLQIEYIAQYILRSNRTIVFTGAGVSTESGIPDFRSSDGIWSKFDPDDFTIQKYVSDPVSRLRQWLLLFGEGPLMDAQPNSAHYAIAELDDLGKLSCVITQNIDNLHQKAGTPPEKVLELHGTLGRAKCIQCGRRSPIDAMLDHFNKNREVAPACEDCGGIVKPDVVFFGEPLPSEHLERAVELSQACDLFIVIGSSLVVYPAALMPAYAKESGARLVIINNAPTDLDLNADVVARGSAGEIMAAVLKRVKAGMPTCA
jgi:NAD-dependent deacetylase